MITNRSRFVNLCINYEQKKKYFFSSTLLDMFFYDRTHMTELVQRRVSKAYLAWKNGEVAVMIRFGQKWIEWRKKPKPVIVRGYGLQVENGGIKLKLGLKNRLDYSDYRLDEQIKGR